MSIAQFSVETEVGVGASVQAPCGPRQRKEIRPCFASLRLTA
jgi:hypothetical protein